jgi:hypothetical protein
MPGSILHMGAVVNCIHVGIATPVASSPNVTVSNQPIITMANTYSVAGCTFPAMTTGAPPCATAQWTTAATQVTSMNQPVVLQDSHSTCIPTGTPLLISGVQPLVTAR